MIWIWIKKNPEKHTINLINMLMGCSLFKNNGILMGYLKTILSISMDYSMVYYSWDCLEGFNCLKDKHNTSVIYVVYWQDKRDNSWFVSNHNRLMGDLTHHSVEHQAVYLFLGCTHGSFSRYCSPHVFYGWCIMVAWYPFYFISNVCPLDLAWCW